MNPIKDFDRLEAMGLWREVGTRQRKEVVVSFGKSTLVLTDINNNPLTHWSLASINHLGQSDRGSIFSADPTGEETLEIEDPTMIAAISKIRSTIDAARPHPGRLRAIFRWGSILIFALLVIFWAPSVVKNYAAHVVPAAKAQEISEAVLVSMERITGKRCTTIEAAEALNRLEVRLFPEQPKDIHVLQLGSRISTTLPDGDVILNGRRLAEMPTPEIAAGFVLAEGLANKENAVMQKLFRSLTIREAARFLSNGKIASDRIDALANQLLFDQPISIDAKALHVRFFETQIPHRPYANFTNSGALAVLPNAQIDNIDPLLSDAEWLAVTEVCNG